MTEKVTPELITGIPEVFDVADYRPGGLEPLSGGYAPSDRKTDNDEAELQMLTRFRGELAFSNNHEDIMRNGYSIARNLADVSIADGGGAAGQNAYNLIEHTRFYARPKGFGLVSSEDSLGSHSRKSQTLRMNHEKLFANDTNHDRVAIETAITLRNPADGLLLSYLRIAAHEAGHSVLAGASSMLESKQYKPEDSGLSASEAYITRNPDQGFTGNLTNDAWIHEERFAEGYGFLAVSRAMELLGYDKAEIEAATDVLRRAPDVDGGRGENQIDYIDAAKSAASIGIQIKSSKPKVPEHQLYEGELGYAVPLTKEQIVKQLSDISDLCKQDTVSVISYLDYDSSRARQAPDVAEAVAAMVAARNASMNIQTKSIRTPEKAAVTTRRTRAGHAIAKRLSRIRST